MVPLPAPAAGEAADKIVNAENNNGGKHAKNISGVAAGAAGTGTAAVEADGDDAAANAEESAGTPPPTELLSLVAKWLPLADVHNNLYRALDDRPDDKVDVITGYLQGNVGALEEIAGPALSSDPTQNAIGLAWLDSWMEANEELVDEYSEMSPTTPLYVKEEDVPQGINGNDSGRDGGGAVVCRLKPEALFYSPLLASLTGNADLLERTLALGPLDINSQCDLGGGARPSTPLGYAVFTGNRRCVEFLLGRDDVDVGAATHPGGWPAAFAALDSFLEQKEESSRGLQYDLNFLESFVGHASADVNSLVCPSGLSLLNAVMVSYIDKKSISLERCAQALCLLMKHGADGQNGFPASPLAIALLKATSEDPQVAVRCKVAWAIVSGKLLLDSRSPLWVVTLKACIWLQYCCLGFLVWPFLASVGAILRFLRLPSGFY